MKSSEWSGPSGPLRILKRWAPLLLGVMAIVLFVGWVAPLIGNMSSIRTQVTVLRESDIDAGAYFYPDVEEVSKAELYVRNSFEFSQRPKE